jgi:hypothetical protein
VRVFYTSHVGTPGEAEADIELDGVLYSGASYEIRVDGGFCQYERSWSLWDHFGWAMYRLRRVLEI